jgi:hypothetical protein
MPIPTRVAKAKAGRPAPVVRSSRPATDRRPTSRNPA